jgi:uncharacterized protein (TIGR04255 family)
MRPRPNRPLPPLLLSRPPLILVLAQVKFSPVLSMEGFVPEIQEDLRKDYPGYKESKSQEILLRDGNLVLAQPLRWLFSDRTRQEAVALTPDFVVLQTSRYKSFDDFSGRLGSILEQVHARVGIGLWERIGLRFINRIVPGSGEPFSDYVHPGLAGVPKSTLSHQGLEFMQAVTRCEVRTNTAMGSQLVIRTFEQASLPPGLENEDLLIPEPPQGSDTLLLDIDHFVSGRKEAFDPENIVATAWDLHHFSDRAFRACTTQKALRTWGAT